MSGALRIGVCSYSFHRLLSQGKQDIFQYITDCKALGCTQLDPWDGHLYPLRENAPKPVSSDDLKALARLSAEDSQYVMKVKAAADRAGLPFGIVLMNAAHIYDENSDKRRTLRANAYRWINIAAALGASMVQIDAGGPEKMSEEQFQTIIAGYQELIGFASDRGIDVLMENHWGPSRWPGNVERILTAVNGLGLLFDTFNWTPRLKALGWLSCVKYARAVHVKTFAFDENGDEVTENLPFVFRKLKQIGFAGPWSVDSAPLDGDELGAARKTIALIKRWIE